MHMRGASKWAQRLTYLIFFSVVENAGSHVTVMMRVLLK